MRRRFVNSPQTPSTATLNAQNNMFNVKLHNTKFPLHHLEVWRLKRSKSKRHTAHFHQTPPARAKKCFDYSSYELSIRLICKSDQNRLRRWAPSGSHRLLTLYYPPCNSKICNYWSGVTNTAPPLPHQSHRALFVPPIWLANSSRSSVLNKVGEPDGVYNQLALLL